MSSLAAGVPIVLIPLFADQPMNALRVAELGAGVALDGGAAVSKLAVALGDVLGRGPSPFRQRIAICEGGTCATLGFGLGCSSGSGLGAAALG